MLKNPLYSPFQKCSSLGNQTDVFLISVPRLWFSFCKRGERGRYDQVQDPRSSGLAGEWRREDGIGGSHLWAEHVSCLRNHVELNRVITAWGLLSPVHSLFCSLYLICRWEEWIITRSPWRPAQQMHTHFHHTASHRVFGDAGLVSFFAF